MAEAKNGDKVRVHYTGRLDDGEVFDTSEQRDPLEFTIGSGEVIPGFDSAVAGMNPGESKTVVLEPANAYGDYNAEMVHHVSRSQLPEDVELEPGMMVQASQGVNETMLLTIKEITEKTITLDANHPLAGKELTFDIQLVEIV